MPYVVGVLSLGFEFSDQFFGPDHIVSVYIDLNFSEFVKGVFLVYYERCNVVVRKHLAGQLSQVKGFHGIYVYLFTWHSMAFSLPLYPESTFPLPSSCFQLLLPLWLWEQPFSEIPATLLLQFSRVSFQRSSQGHC